MSVSPETEWVLVVCGLIAHADGTLEGNEVERLMTMVDDRIPPEDYSDWLLIMGDKGQLEARYAALTDPPAASHRALLEEAWTMAMADGSRNTDELVVLTKIADRLGVDPMQLEFWREAWTHNEQVFAEAVAGLAAAVLAGTERMFDDDVSPFLDLIERLPTSAEERDRLGGFADGAPDAGTVARGLASMPRSRRIQAFGLVAPLSSMAVDAENARTRFVDIGRAAGLLDIDRLF